MRNLLSFPFTVLLIIPLWESLHSSPVVDCRLELVSSDFKLADGPSWDGWSLTVPDPLAQQVLRFVEKKKEWMPPLRNRKFSASFYNHGKTYFADYGEGAIRCLDQNRKWITLHQEDLTLDKSRRPNDLVVDRLGGVFYTLTKAGQVVYVPINGKAKVVTSDAETANGIILSPDEKTLYVSEYVPKQVIAYQVGQDGQLSNRRVLAKMDDGQPELKGADGMTVDRAGNVYCAGPTDVWIWAPDGKLVDKISCPAKLVSCAFGGTNLSDLYIACRGGLYLQKMKVSGVSPQPSNEIPVSQKNKRPSLKIPEGVSPYFDLTFAQYGTRDMLADIFVPSGKGIHPAILIIHGGGWVKGDKTKFRAMGLELARRGYVTMAASYRLSGEAKFPANIHDCHAAIRFLRAKAKKFHIDPERIGVVGGSAGGHLAGLLATTEKVKQLHGSGGNPQVSSAVQAAVVMSGPMEIATGSVAEKSLLADNSKSNAVILFGGTVKEKPELYSLADAHLHISKATPPILFQFGGTEDPSKVQPSVEKLKKMGVSTKVLSHYKDGKHGCWNSHPWFMPMIADIDSWFKEHLKDS